jgi:hypothetical protein
MEAAGADMAAVALAAERAVSIQRVIFVPPFDATRFLFLVAGTG